MLFFLKKKIYLKRIQKNESVITEITTEITGGAVEEFREQLAEAGSFFILLEITLLLILFVLIMIMFRLKPPKKEKKESKKDKEEEDEED